MNDNINPAQVVANIQDRMAKAQAQLDVISEEERELKNRRQHYQRAIDECRALLGIAPVPFVRPGPDVGMRTVVERHHATPEALMKRMAIAKAVLRGGRTETLDFIHKSIIKEIGAEAAGTTGALVQQMRKYPKIFDQPGRGLWRLHPDAHAEED